MKQILFSILALSSFCLSAQHELEITVLGTKGEAGLPRASVRLGDEWITTNETGYGEFVNLKDSVYTLSIGYIGYHDTTYEFRLSQDTAIVVSLSARKQTLVEVEVWDERLSSGEQVLMKNVLRSEVLQTDVKSRPLIGGEPDVLKPLQSVPGVQTGFPGSAELYVRGSDLYQNSVMLDGFSIYNVSHGFGYVSAIPPSVVQKLNFYKEAFPVEYANGVSSFLDADILRANTQHWKGHINGGIGSLSGHVEVPIEQNKSGVLIGGRFSTSGIILEGLKAFGVEIDDFTTGFNDAVIKYHHRLSPKTEINVLGYYASDYIKNSDFPADGKLGLSNSLLGLTLHKQLSRGGWSSHKASYSNLTYRQKYSYKYPSNQIHLLPGDQFQYHYSINTLKWQSLWSKKVSNRVRVKLGGDLEYSNFQSPRVEVSSVNLQEIFKGQQHEPVRLTAPSLFGSIKWQMTPEVSLVSGIRLTPYFYDENLQIAALPRVLVMYHPLESTSLFLSYDETAQASHRFRNTNYSSSLDFPLAPSKDLPVQTAKQLAFGGAFSQGAFQCQLQGFYRYLKNTTDRNYYQDQVLYTLDEEIIPPANPANTLMPVNGEAYGLETSLSYKWSIFSLNLAYTWSRSFRHSNELNENEPYRFEYNRDHFFKTDFITRFKRNELGKIVQIGASFTYGSGRYSQFPLQFQNAPVLPGNNRIGGLLPLIPRRNNVLLPSIHHLDVVINFIAQKEKGVRTFSISVFNVYLSQLTTGYSYDATGDLEEVEPITILPTISYSYEF